MADLDILWDKAVNETIGLDAIKTRQRFMELAQYTDYSLRELINYLGRK